MITFRELLLAMLLPTAFSVAGIIVDVIGIARNQKALRRFVQQGKEIERKHTSLPSNNDRGC